MAEKQEKIYNYYKDRIDSKKEDYLIHGWESRSASEKRLMKLFEVCSLDNSSLLDVGCGVGTLAGLLCKNNIAADYTGVDILPEMVRIAEDRYPGNRFLCLDIFSEPDFLHNRYDFIYSSGIFNINMGNNEEFVEKALRAFASMAKKKIVINFLHDTSSNPEPEYFYTNPEKIFKVVEKSGIIYDDLKIFTDYLANDFTLVISGCTV